MLVSSLLLQAAMAAPLRFDPAAPPLVLGPAEAYGPGAVHVRFELPRPVELPALPAAVVALWLGVAIPPELEREGIRLGKSGRSWKIPARPGETGVDVARRWAGHPAVESVVPDLVLHHRAAFDDPEYESQWYLERIAMQALFDQSLGSPDIRVAVIDSAFELDHPDLEAAFADGYDAHDEDDDPSVEPGAYCPDGSVPDTLCDEHGTAVSGIIGARANNGEGIVGMCAECGLIPIRMLGDTAGSTSADVAAFEHAMDQDAAVINNSWGFNGSMPVPGPLAAVIERAETETRGGLGSVVVFSAGNDDREIVDDELQAIATVLCVSATTSYGVPTAYTNYGAAVDLAAPSATFTTTVYGSYTEDFGGTSAAAPVVSGMAAWILSVAPVLSAAEVRDLLVASAVMPGNVTQVDDAGHNAYYGYGELTPAEILATLFPEPADTDSEETPRACGCSASAAFSSGWPLAAAVLVLSRRRSRGHGAR
jgi:subtilisin family serine protease